MPNKNEETPFGGGRIHSVAVTDRSLKMLLAIAFLAMAILRFVALRADNPTTIDFSLGQFTDETYYTMNARNQVLFGRPNLDEFNNMIMSPVLHLVHLANFEVFGVGATEARSVSAVFGLLTILALFWGLNRAFGLRVAALGMLLLGFDHIFLLFNREALMDTPSCFPAMVAFGCFVAALRSSRGFWWLAACGVLAVLSVITRSQQAPVILVPFLALFLCKRPKETLPVFVGLTVALGVYLIAWYLPHKAEINHINEYFKRTLWGPTSGGEVLKNVAAALFRPEGVVGYFARSSPWLMVGAVLGLILASSKKIDRPRRHTATPTPDSQAGEGSTLPPLGTEGERRGWPAQPDGGGTSSEGLEVDPIIERPAAAFLAAYLVLEMLAFAVVSYTPGRYMMIMLPPMAGLAAIGFMRLDAVREALDRSFLARLFCFLAWTFIAHHVVGPALASLGKAPQFIGAFVVGALLAWGSIGLLRASTQPRGVSKVALAAALALNAFWLGDWATHLTYGQARAADWANTNIPRDAVIVNGVWLGLDSRFHALSILSATDRKDPSVHLDLSNMDHPLQRNMDKPLYLVWPHTTTEPGKPPVESPEYGNDALGSATLLHSEQVRDHTVDIYKILPIWGRGTGPGR